MAIHILLVFYICLIAIPVYSMKQLSYVSRKKLYVVLAFLPMVFIAAFRKVSVGLDTIVYRNAYYAISSSSNSWEEQNWEKGFVLVNKIIGAITHVNEQAFFGIISCIILIGCGIFIIENSEDIGTFFPVFLFVTLNNYFTSMVSLRQYCALAIGINSYTVLKRDNSLKGVVKSIIIILIAMSFHNSAFVLLTFPLLFMIKRITRKIVVFTAVAGVIVYQFFTVIMNLLFKIFTGFARYTVNGNVKFEGVKLGKVYIVLLMVKIIIAVCVFCLSEKEKENRELYILVVLNVVSVIISFLTMRVALVWRLGYYFDIMIILLLPKIINRIKGIEFIPHILTFAAGSIYFIYLCLVNTAGCVPYLFYWQ